MKKINLPKKTFLVDCPPEISNDFYESFNKKKYIHYGYGVYLVNVDPSDWFKERNLDPNKYVKSISIFLC